MMINLYYKRAQTPMAPTFISGPGFQRFPSKGTIERFRVQGLLSLGFRVY